MGYLRTATVDKVVRSGITGCSIHQALGEKRNGFKVRTSVKRMLCNSVYISRNSNLPQRGTVGESAALNLFQTVTQRNRFQVSTVCKSLRPDKRNSVRKNNRSNTGFFVECTSVDTGDCERLVIERNSLRNLNIAGLVAHRYFCRPIRFILRVGNIVNYHGCIDC